jgi:uncharacterized protein (DUF58 family)
MTSFRRDRWHPTAALLVACALVATALTLAVALRRPDLVVVAAPLAIGVVFPLLRGPVRSEAEAVRLSVAETSVWEGDTCELGIEVGCDATVDLARVAIEHGPGVDAESGATIQCLLPAPGRPARGGLSLRAGHWGRSLIGPVGVVFTGAHGLLRRDGPTGPTSSITVVPLRSVFEAIEAMPQAAGLVGTHRSRRPGTGTDLLAIRPFAPGDRLRRITWPVSLRTGQLHVTSTTDDRDADVQVIVDTAVVVGDPDTEFGTSLDVTVRAAASVAEHYLRQGDRVGLIDLGTLRPPVLLGAGRRHMLPLLAGLLGASAGTRADDERADRRLRQVPPRALVMVFSPLLDESIGRYLAMLAQRGHTALVVDTLPEGVQLARRTEWTAVAWRIALLARETLTHRLVDLGVPVVPWRGARSLDQVLVRLSRAAAIPRRSR